MAEAMSQDLIPVERIAAQIYVIRGQSVMLDSDLAALYGVSTSRLNEQVKRNRRRFPDDFSFPLTAEEALMSQFAISKGGRGGQRKPPRVFSEQGVAMLSSVLRSDRAADGNVAMMRTFVRLRGFACALAAVESYPRSPRRPPPKCAVFGCH